MFALDHPNYARWLPVHIRNMMLLEECHLDVAAEFKKGNSVVRWSRTYRMFLTATQMDSVWPRSSETRKRVLMFIGSNKR